MVSNRNIHSTWWRSTVSVEQANEIVAELRELETEHNLMKDFSIVHYARANRAVT